MNYVGEIAALGTAISWSVNSLLSTYASHRIGSFSMSHYRMLFGTILIAVAWFIFDGPACFAETSSRDIILLALSGLAGYFLCDTLLFQCFVDLSPRLGILIFSSYPFVAALLAWFFLDEVLSVLVWLGMAVTTTGIAWVVLEKGNGKIQLHRPHFRRGVFLAIGAFCFQGISFTLAKPAMMGPDAADPLTATLIRAIVGGAAFWLVSIIRGRFRVIIRKASDFKSVGMIALGAIIGPSLGVWLSMVAIKNAPVGIASTLMALMPVIILPMTAIAYKERISWRAVIGAIVACFGVAILFNA